MKSEKTTFPERGTELLSLLQSLLVQVEKFHAPIPACSELVSQAMGLEVTDRSPSSLAAGEEGGEGKIPVSHHGSARWRSRVGCSLLSSRSQEGAATT